MNFDPSYRPRKHNNHEDEFLEWSNEMEFLEYIFMECLKDYKLDRFTNESELAAFIRAAKQRAYKIKRIYSNISEDKPSE